MKITFTGTTLHSKKIYQYIGEDQRSEISTRFDSAKSDAFKSGSSEDYFVFHSLTDTGNGKLSSVIILDDKDAILPKDYQKEINRLSKIKKLSPQGQALLSTLKNGLDEIKASALKAVLK